MATPGGDPSGWNLTHKRQLVEQLDAEPLLDYLHRNGVLQESDLMQLREQESAVKRNVHLLHSVEDHGRLGQSLLVNALRQSGQLQLANLVDDSARIRTFSGSGYLSKKRHKGQVNLSIQVRAIKFALSTLPVLPKGVPRSMGLSTREWVSAEDIQTQMSALLEPPPTQFSSIQQLQLVEDSSPHKTQSSCCLCSCLSAIFKKRKGPKKDPPERASVYKSTSNGVSQGANNNDPRRYSIPLAHGRGDVPSSGGASHFVSSHSSAHISTSPNPRAPHGRESLEQLQALLELMNNKSNELYQLLQEGELELQRIMSQYWEQQRGILFLQADVRSEALVLSLICTKGSQVEQLRRDLTSGYLLKDMEGFIVTDQVLAKLDVLGLKLKLSALSDELDTSEQELL